MRTQAALLVAFASCSIVLAHDSFSIPDPESEPLPLVAPQPTPAYTPLTTKENFRYGENRVFNPGKLLLFGLEAAMDQGREVPGNWDRECNHTPIDTPIASGGPSFAKTWLSECVP